ncbi:sensor histidine kinase, partial [Streptomyces sp. NPDC058953]|uniref:sensor histidine kinase n=1 Tax=Streptomyces sp. NPDC058953 TaxID=3346676 RepID=UPI0036BA19D7
MTAVAGALAALAAAPVLAAALARPPARRTVPAALSGLAVRAARIELRRLERCCGVRPPVDLPPDRALRYVACRVPLGLLGGLILGVMAVGLFWLSVGLLGWFVISVDYPVEVVGTGLLGAFLLVLGAQGVYGTMLMEERLVRHVFDPEPHEALRSRIDHRAPSRADVVDAFAAERLRSYRSLTAGGQPRRGALGMLLGRARRSTDPERAGRLLLSALEENRRALAELREVAWRVHPAVLDEAGLGAALESVAERTPLPLRPRDHQPGAPPPPPRAPRAAQEHHDRAY